MLKIENVTIEGWESAIRGMRNPMNSWTKSDSYEGYDCHACGKIDREGSCAKADRDEGVCKKFHGWQIGPNDRKLMESLRDAGSDHAKYRRMIVVWCDILAPLYWWKEFDTYKVGTVANSCSTMHKIAEKEFVLDDFSHEHLSDFARDYILGDAIHELNVNRHEYLVTGEKQYWWNMIQLLPSSYNQKRTIMLNYEVLANIYPARRNHKLDEWHTFCDWIESLPESWIIVGETEDERIEKLYSAAKTAVKEYADGGLAPTT